MSMPETMSILGLKEPQPTDPKIYAALVAEAEADKAWAAAHEYAAEPESWPASSLSIQMLQERLTLSVDDLVAKRYAYKGYRARLGTPGRWFDPLTREWWEKTSGMLLD